MSQSREIWASEEPADAALKARRTLEKLGELVHVEPGISLEGKIAFGVQSVTVKIMWRPEEASNGKTGGSGGTATADPRTPGLLGTLLVLEAKGDTPAAESSALERFEEAFFHYGDPAYKPDRLGVMPLTIIAIFIVLLLVGIMLWRNPAIRKHLPNIPGHPDVRVPTPSPVPGASPDSDDDSASSK